MVHVLLPYEFYSVVIYALPLTCCASKPSVMQLLYPADSEKLLIVMAQK